jgi:hypothetical protein
MDGLLRNISIGVDGSIWGVNKEGKMYTREPNKWREIGGRAVQISCYDAHRVVHVNSAGNMWYLNDVNSKDPWKGMSGQLIHISVGRDACCGCNKDNQIWTRGTTGLIIQ